MYTSDNYKTSIKYLVISIIVFIFSLIYEYFSHGVYSNFMIFAYLIPLLFGSLPFFILKNKSINNITKNLYHCIIATLTIASIIKGVLDIYGTTNSLIYYYFYTSIVLFILIIIFIVKEKKSEK